MKSIIASVLGLLLLSSCGKREDVVQQPPPVTSTRTYIGDGYYVKEFQLSDGTHCAVLTGTSLICNWK